MRNHGATAITTTTGEGTADRTTDGLVAISLLLLVVPLLLSSTPSFIAWPRLAALALMLPLSRRISAANPQRGFRLAAAGILAVYVSSVIGGSMHHHHTVRELVLAAKGLTAIAGLAVFIAVVLRGRFWRRAIRCLLAGISLVLLVSSLGAYFLPIQELIPMGGLRIFFDPVRIPLIWPTRLMMSGANQIGWEHTNTAGLLFSLCLVFVLEGLLAGEVVKRRLWWIFATALVTAIFLTGSRSALLMLAAAAPCLLIGRKVSQLWPCMLAAVTGIAFGVLALKTKEALMRPPAAATSSSAAQAAPPPDVHLTGLIVRGSSGRTSAYAGFLRNDTEGARVFGKGLSQNGRPMGNFNHEHSSYLATFRGGGAVALLAHAAIIGLCVVSAFRLFRRGVRWPLLLQATVLPAILFDRGSVFLLNGSYEFLLHWTALLCPFFAAGPVKPLHPPSSPDPAAPQAPRR